MSSAPREDPTVADPISGIVPGSRAHLPESVPKGISMKTWRRYSLYEQWPRANQCLKKVNNTLRESLPGRPDDLRRLSKIPSCLANMKSWIALAFNIISEHVPNILPTSVQGPRSTTQGILALFVIQAVLHWGKVGLSHARRQVF